MIYRETVKFHEMSLLTREFLRFEYCFSVGCELALALKRKGCNPKIHEQQN